MNFSLSGIPNWTFDIGGFALEARYLKPNEADLAEWRELNLRWFQFGALAPLFRSHGELPFREIFNLAPEGSDVYNSLVWYDRLRYRLLPYIYTLAADTYHRDGSIMRALVMDFPKDIQTRNIDDEYLLGSALLVSPVYEYGARVRSVYLPAGSRWYDFYNGTAYEGGVRIAAPAPVERIPLFVRAGSIVPIGPAIEYSDQKSDAPLTLYVYTGESGRFDLYEDDGLSLGYERGEFARIPITYEEATGRLTIGKRAGAYPGMASHRAFNVRWISGPHGAIDFNAKPDAHVDFDGEAVSIVRAR
jgi:alpha-D-xyloside xylohydrolase